MAPGAQVSTQARWLFAVHAVIAEAGPALARCRVILGVGGCRVFRWDREDDGVMHHRRVLGLELASGQECGVVRVGSSITQRYSSVPPWGADGV